MHPPNALEVMMWGTALLIIGTACAIGLAAVVGFYWGRRR